LARQNKFQPSVLRVLKSIYTHSDKRKAQICLPVAVDEEYEILVEWNAASLKQNKHQPTVSSFVVVLKSKYPHTEGRNVKICLPLVVDEEGRHR